MAKQIKGNEVIEDNHLDNAIKQAEIYLGLQKSINEQIVKNAKALKTAQASAGGANSAKGIKAQTAALSESEKKKKAVLKTDKDIINAEVKLKALRSNKTQKLAELNVLNQQQAKINKQLAREKLNLVGAYEKESQKLIGLRKKLKDVIIAEGAGAKSTQKLAAQVNRLDAKLKKADAAAGQFQRNVGNYPSKMKGAIGSLKKFAGALGLFGGIQLAIRGIRNMFNVVKNFDQATADLSSVLGVNADQMSELTAQAKELGATTKFTASQVSELQLEFAKLGFTQKEISEVTEATLQLAAAAGTELGNAATIVGSTMRAFGLETTETQRVVDVMAKSFSTSSLDIEKFKAAMASVAPVAKGAGFSIEETTALLGTLTDSGIDAGTAGTGLRNIFLELTKSGMTFEDAMSAINNSTNKNKTSLDLFGKRGAALGVILAENGVTIDALTDKLEHSGGAAEEMADKQLNTLGGAVELLKSAWEGFILKMNDSSGAGAKLTAIIRFLAENLDAILSGLILLTKAFAAYKLVVKGAAAVNQLFGKSVIKNVKGAGLWAAALMLVVAAVVKVWNGLINAKSAQDQVNETLDRANVLLGEEKNKLNLVGRELLKTKIASKERGDVLAKINAEYGTTLENLEDEAAFANQLASAYQKVVNQLKQKINIEIINEDIKSTMRDIKEMETEFKSFNELEVALDLTRALSGESLAVNIDKQKTVLEGLFKELDGFTEGVKSGKGKGTILGDRFNRTSKEIKGTTKEIKDNREEIVKWRRDIEKLGHTLETTVDNQFKKDPFIVGPMKKATEIAQKEFKKRQAALREFRDRTLDIVKSITKGIEQNIDKRIEARKKEVSESATEIERLQGLAAAGNTDAAEAIKAERIKQAKDKIEIEALEKKKRNLLITTTALEKASMLIGTGDGNAFANASAQMKDFLGNLPTFFEGTTGTVAQALGATGTRDGHMVRVHDNEHIIGSKDSSTLHAAGLNSNADIVESALAYHNNSMNSKAVAVRKIAAFTDSNIVSKLDSVEKAIKDIKIVQQHIDLSTGIETITDGKKTTRNNHRPSTFKI